jgi:hypothetical protein
VEIEGFDVVCRWLGFGDVRILEGVELRGRMALYLGVVAGRLFGEVGGGDLEDVGEESCTFEVHAVGGEACGEVSEGLLDGVAGEGGGDLEGLVLVDGRDDFVSVGKAHVVVVHGDGAAAAAVAGVGVHALVGDGGLALEVVVGRWHGLAPPGVCLPVFG